MCTFYPDQSYIIHFTLYFLFKNWLILSSVNNDLNALGKLSLKQLESIHKYILEESDSLTTADKVINKILTSSKVLSEQPEMHPTDKYKLNNTGSYRAYEVYSYRIAYRILKDKVRILRVRHTSREPLKY